MPRVAQIIVGVTSMLLGLAGLAALGFGLLILSGWPFTRLDSAIIFVTIGIILILVAFYVRSKR